MVLAPLLNSSMVLALLLNSLTKRQMSWELLCKKDHRMCKRKHFRVKGMAVTGEKKPIPHRNSTRKWML